MKKLMVLLATVCLIVIGSWALSLAQSLTEKPNLQNNHLQSLTPNQSRFSLLDLSRLKIQNSYTFSYLSLGKRAASFGVYTTSLEYQISNPITLNVDLSYLHQPFSVGKNNLNLDSRILPNFRLNYSPNPNFNFSINFITYNNYYLNNLYYEEETR